MYPNDVSKEGREKDKDHRDGHHEHRWLAILQTA